MVPGSPRKGAEENYREMLELCRRYRVYISVGSDAHLEFDARRHDCAYRLLEEIQFPGRTGIKYILGKDEETSEPGGEEDGHILTS